MAHQEEKEEVLSFQDFNSVFFSEIFVMGQKFAPLKNQEIFHRLINNFSISSFHLITVVHFSHIVCPEGKCFGSKSRLTREPNRGSTCTFS